MQEKDSSKTLNFAFHGPRTSLHCYPCPYDHSFCKHSRRIWSRLLKGVLCSRTSPSLYFALDTFKEYSVMSKMSAPFTSSFRCGVRGGVESAQLTDIIKANHPQTSVLGHALVGVISVEWQANGSSKVCSIGLGSVSGIYVGIDAGIWVGIGGGDCYGGKDVDGIGIVDDDG
ncbi:hypothetical protein Tco_0449365 [Tanacetum coccineum]